MITRDTITKQPRADWKMIDKPIDACPLCSQPIVQIAYSEEGWELWWGCNNDDCAACRDGTGEMTIEEMELVYIDWPFDLDETASIEDLMALGFEHWRA